MFVAVVALAWVFQERLGIEKGSLLMFSGAAVIIITVSSQNRRTRRELAASELHIQKNRELIGTIDYKDY
ncbi:MAG: hypothetical protein FWG90_01360 [Oscillospiraceae bacterium]|nr:hypothetical protein [Oscillospiraceae bacterium]